MAHVLSRSGQICRAALAPPCDLAKFSQRRWDTSPYRNAHKLTWARLNRPRWPRNGSLVWAPTWGFQKPLPPEALALAWDSRPRVAAPAGDLHAPPKVPQLLHRRLQESLSLDASDALVLVQRSRVTVDGKIQSRDRWVKDEEIAVNGYPLSELAELALLAHKPAGMALTEGDPLKRETYRALLPDRRLLARPGGAVDLGSSGLLVLTNQNGLLNALRSANLRATFLVHLREQLRPSQLAVLESSAPWGRGNSAPVSVEQVEQGPAQHDVQVEHSTRAELPSTEPDLAGLVQWPGRLPSERKAFLPQSDLLTSLRVVLPGPTGAAARLRQALAFVGAGPAASISCVGLGPLRIDGSDLGTPRAVRPLSQPEIKEIIWAASTGDAAGQD